MGNKFIKQFEFEFWSNSLILESLRQIPEKQERAQLLFSHLLSSHCMWLSRVTKTEFTCTLFQERTLDECEKLMYENLNGWKNYLADKSEIDLEQTIAFIPAWETEPIQRKMKLEDAIIHILGHSSYHRGQIVASLKGKIEPLPFVTYIMFASEVVE